MLVYQRVSHSSSTVSSVNFSKPKFCKQTLSTIFRPAATLPNTQANSPGEKRNATEIMHAYVGSGLEVLADKGARVSCFFGEFFDGCELPQHAQVEKITTKPLAAQYV